MEAAAVQLDSPPADGRQSDKLQGLLKIQVPLIVKLAERKMRLADVVQLSVGLIIELDHPAEEPLDLLVNNVAVGQGEVVKVGENFGLRISRMGLPQQTIRALGGADSPSGV